MAAQPELNSDFVAQLIWTKLYLETLKRPKLFMSVKHKGVFATLLLKSKADVMSNGVAINLDRLEGFVFKVKLKSASGVQKMLVFYRPFEREFYLVDAAKFKCKPVVGSVFRKKVFRRVTMLPIISPVEIAEQKTVRVYRRKVVVLVDK